MIRMIEKDHSREDIHVNDPFQLKRFRRPRPFDRVEMQISAPNKYVRAGELIVLFILHVRRF